MARIPMVTRTITTTKAVCLCVDIAKGETFNDTKVLPRTYKDKNDVLKMLNKINEDENIKVVSVISTEEIETMYGMLESKFIELAEVLDNETRKPVSEKEVKKNKKN